MLRPFLNKLALLPLQIQKINGKNAKKVKIRLNNLKTLIVHLTKVLKLNQMNLTLLISLDAPIPLQRSERSLDLTKQKTKLGCKKPKLTRKTLKFYLHNLHNYHNYPYLNCIFPLERQ